MTGRFAATPGSSCWRCGGLLEAQRRSMTIGALVVEAYVERVCRTCGLEHYPASAIEQFGRAMHVQPPDSDGGG